MAAKKVQLKDKSGNKAYPVTSSACVGMSDGSGNLDNHINKITTEYNVSLFHPTDGVDGGNKYTLETAIAKVPAELRNVGIKCSFLDEAGLLDTWEYQGGTFTNVSSWNQVGAKKFLELTVAPVSNRAYSDVGKNLFNKNAVKTGYYLNQNGKENVNNVCNISDYILVEPNTQYTKKVNSANTYTAFYDENLNLLGAVNTATFTTPENTKFIRISMNNTALNSQQLEIGTTSTFYTEYTDNAGIEKKIGSQKCIKLTKNPGKNLLDPADVQKNKWISGANGNISDISGWCVTGLIPISEGQTLYISGNRNQCRGILYDKNMNVIHVTAAGESTITYVEGAVYAVFTVRETTYPDNIQVEVGSEETTFEPFLPRKDYDGYIKEYLHGSFLGKVSSLLQYKKCGKNLLDPSDVLDMHWISNDSGSIRENSYNFLVTGYIPIDERNLVASSNTNFESCRYNLYDKDLNLIHTSDMLTGVKEINVQYVEGASYARITFNSNAANITTREEQVEVGDTATRYEAYTDNAEWQEEIDKIPELENAIANVITLEPEYNLFDKNAVTEDRFFSTRDDGNTLNINSFNKEMCITDFIPIKPNTQYSKFGINSGGGSDTSFIASWVFFDENKEFIQGEAQGNYNTVTSPENAAYVRLCMMENQKDTGMVVEGEVPSRYSPYKLIISEEYIPSSLSNALPEPEFVLPNTLYFLKDKPFIYYYENMFIKSQYRKLRTIFKAPDLGSSRDTVFYGSPSNAGVGTIDVSYTLENLNTIKHSLNYNVIDPNIQRGKTVNILCVGDSFTDMGVWQDEISKQLSENGITCNLIGTQHSEYGIKGEALSGGTLSGFLLKNAGPGIIVDVNGISTLPNTSYGGTSYRDSNNFTWDVRGYVLNEEGDGKLFLGNYDASNKDSYEASENIASSGILTKTRNNGDDTINYSNKEIVYFNPFWNPETKSLDFSYYINKWGFTNPDFLIIQFTFNDLSLWLDAKNSSIDNFVKSITTVIDKFHSQFPLSKVIFSIEPQGSLLPSDVDNEGRNYSFLNFAKKMYETFENNTSYNTWFKISPSYAGVDRINGYGSQEVVLSSRYPDIKTKVASGDTTHCNSQGMCQIGDMVVPVIYSLI